MKNNFNIVYDRNKKTYYQEEIFGFRKLNFYYNTFLGRVFLKFIILKFFSKIYGWYMNSKLSIKKINKFVEKNKIDLKEYESKNYTSFNDFFTRKIRPENRIIDKNNNNLIAISDGKLKYVKITDGMELNIKDTIYSLDELLKNKVLAKKYAKGDCLIIRLTVSDYHRYCYLDDGTKGKNKKIKGVLHTVNSISHGKYKIYAQNSREYTILNTNNFGQVIQMEVGALLVGKINNYCKNKFIRGEEKGYFEFGGSTIILLFEKGKINIDKDIEENSIRNIETKVKMGEKIGGKYVK